jgi:hypothetical protein
MKNNQNTKFIGMDVHKFSISLAIAAKGAEERLNRAFACNQLNLVSRYSRNICAILPYFFIN